MLKLDQVMVTLEGMRTAGDRRALPEAYGKIKEALVARGPAMFMEPVEEREALQKVLEVTIVYVVWTRRR